MDVCDQPRRLLLNMSPDQADQTEIEATLAVDGELTRLVVEERGLSIDEAPSYGAGWQAHVEDLAAYLGGRATGEWKVRWAELVPVYRELHLDPGTG